MNIADYISVDSNLCLDKPCFKGTIIMVYLVLDLLEAGVTVEDIGPKYYPQLTRKHFEAAQHYASLQIEPENIPIKLLCDENVLLQRSLQHSKNGVLTILVRFFQHTCKSA